MLIRYPTIKRIHISFRIRLYSTTNKDPLVTPYERDQLSKLPFFEESNIERDPIQTNKTYTKEKKIYIRKKINAVKSVVGTNPNDLPFLSYDFHKSLPTMYDCITDSKSHGRLSVTKMMTKSWCELRYSYDAYSKLDKLVTRNISSGISFHKSLEDKLVVENEDLQDFLQLQQMESFQKSIVYKWQDTMERLINMFSSDIGEAREILCHGYIENKGVDESQDGKFLNDVDAFVEKSKDDSKNVMLVSGIIDHLKWIHNSETYTKFDLFDDIFNDINITNDLSILISSLQIEIPKRIDNWKLQLTDVKTRQMFTIPNQTSVQRASKLQIMYYKKFLDILTLNPEHTYSMLLLNAKKRDLDIDKPLEPLEIVALMMKNPSIIPDMRRLRDGEGTNFKPYDTAIPQKTVDFKDFSEQYNSLPPDLKEKFQEFMVTWKKPVTLRYFAARLAQTYNLFNTLLSDDLLIEYYCRGKNFHNVPFKYNELLLKEHNSDRTNYLLGKRHVEPIDQTLENFLTYCKHCEYQSICSWKHEGEQKLKTLGKELTDLWVADNN